jgi:serine/threonine protein kinase
MASATLSATVLEKRGLTFEQKIQVIEDIAAGLAHAHTQGVIHRDVCPENIYLRATGAALVNFDCARIADANTINANVQKDLDPRYLAPEVRSNCANATAASDVYALGLIGYELLTGKLPPLQGTLPAPSTVDPLIDAECDRLLQRMLASEAAERPTASEVRDTLSDLRERRRAPSLPPSALHAVPPSESSSPEYRIGDTIDGQYLVRDILGEGSFGKVYRVYSAVTDREYAMKIFRDPGLGLEDAQQEFAALVELSHPRIAHVWHAARLHQGTYYLLTSFIEGRPLNQVLAGAQLAPRDALRSVSTLLEALGYLHAQGYVHRDIKPSNVIQAANGTVLIDFSTAVRSGSLRASPGGTPLYAPPDVTHCEVTAGRDLFAVGVILFEMLTGKHPYGGVPVPGRTPHDPHDFQPRLAPALAALLQRAVAPDAAHRFDSTDAFLAALNTIDEPLTPIPPEPKSVGGITISDTDRARPNYNPYLTHFLTLYSQNRFDNSGTRGYDQISRATYVRTLLDKQLAPDILAGKLRLVFITGNAGDGKTAFLQSLEESLLAGRDGRPPVPVQRLPSGNGATFNMAGRAFQTNYDGSQNEGDQQNDDVLAAFFAPFAGMEAEVALRPDNLTRLIAINEGKLRDFLAHRQAEYPWLAEALLDYLDAGKPLPDGYVMVNLNERAVVTGADSILARQIDALCNPAFWEPCRACAYAARCPVKANVDTFNHPDLSQRVRRRLERLFEIVHLRGSLHLTMRAVRSALAYILFGEEDCTAIAIRLDNTVSQPDQIDSLLHRFYYNAISAAPEDRTDSEIPAEETDRLLRLLSEADPGLGANPEDDRDLHFQGVQSTLLSEGIGLAGYDRELLQAQSERWQADMDDPSTLAAMQHLHAMLRRKAFFERAAEDWDAMLPYTQLQPMLQACRGDVTMLATLKTTILQGINSGEGLGDITDRLVLRVARGTSGRVRSYRQFLGTDFRLQVPRPPLQPEYIEHFPAYLELIYRPGVNGTHGQRPTLRLGLDIIELLGRMARGYAPTAAEWRGPLVNLMVFRTLLTHEAYDQLLLVDTVQDRRFSVKQSNGQIALAQEDASHAPL